MSKALTAIFGEELQDQSGKTVATTTALEGKEAVGLYFSAHWCPPCRHFTPILGKKYKALLDAGKKVEIVFVSSDSDEAAFNGYVKEHPWIRLPYSARQKKQELSEKYGVRGIPTLVFIDGVTGETITTSGRGGVSADSFIDDFPYHPKPCYDIAENLDGIQEKPSLVVLMEGAEAKVKEGLGSQLWDLAEKEKAKPEADRRLNHFFTAKSTDGPSDKIRRGVGLPSLSDDKEKVPRMVILDLNKEGATYTPDASISEVTVANIETFLDKFKAGDLTSKQFKM
jgi:thiol-disulfide isomerase/thioredoxin